MKFKNVMRKYGPSVAAVSLGASTSMAHALGGTIDASAAIALLSGDVTTQIAAVGVAIFTLSGLAMGISWVKATFFG